MNYKDSEWPDFNESMRQLILSQRDEVLRSLSGRGQYRLDKEYAHLVVAPQQWVKMKPEQRKQLVKQFDNMKLKCITIPPVSQTTQSTTSSAPQEGQEYNQTSKHLSISAADSNICTLPKATLDAMWNKAEEYLKSSNGVLPAPGSDKKSKMVASRHGTTPHFVTVSSSGQYCCDKNCIQWCSSKICSHILVSAEVNGELQVFLQWYLDSSQEPKITQLANFGLPAGRGHKGGIAKRKRSKTVALSSAIVTQRPATVCTASKQLVGQQGMTCLNTANQYLQQCTVSQFEDQQPIVQEAVSQQAMVHQHSTVTTSPTSMTYRPVSAHSYMQLTGHNQDQSSSFVTVPTHATISTIQEGCSFSQSDCIQSSNSSYCSNSSYVLPVTVTGNSNVISALPNQTLIFQNTVSPSVTPTFHLSPQPNINPLYVKFIVGNMRVCQLRL